jgi:hypothetical protein
MTMTPHLRKFALTAHVTFSVGWLGAVAGFLTLSVAGLTSQDAQMVRAAYLAMELTASYVIVPFSLASLLTGLVQSLGTKWGVFRHYWILAKLLITILSTIVLLVHMQPISYMAEVAAETTLSSADLLQLRIQLVANACAALLALLVATTLSVYKPRGMTPYGRRKQHEPSMRKLLLRRATEEDTHLADPFSSPDSNGDSIDDIDVGPNRGSTSTPCWMKVFGIIVIVLVLLFVILHLTGGGLGGHTPPT